MTKPRAFRRLLPILLAAIWLWLPQAAVATPLRQSVPVHALVGMLRAAEDQTFRTNLITSDGSVYALLGFTPEIETQIQTLLAQGPELVVKVWGDLYPQGRGYTGPEIIVSDIQPAGTVQPPPTATATPVVVSDEPIAIGRFESVNLHGGPGQEHPVVGQMVQGQACLIIARNEINSWLLVRCSSTSEGWVTTTVVNLQGDLSSIPVVVVATPAPPTPTPTPTPTPPPLLSNWQASYFANRSLEGQPVLVQDVPAVDFDWGLGSPASVVPVDNFSARFERVLNFIPGTYRLCICNVDDGARLIIDDQLVLNDWAGGAARDLVVEQPLSGEHRLLIEYYEAVHVASIRFVYASSSGSLGDWQAAYWNDGALVSTRSEPRPASGYALDYNWGAGSPIPGVVNPDNFSARWQAPFYFDAGNYLFNINSDDGVRVSIDGAVVVDAWQGGYKELSTPVYGVTGGQHQIQVDFYEHVGDAIVRVWWNLDRGVRDE